MSGLIAAVAERLRAGEVPFAVVGAAAMSARGFPRQTLDFDLFTTERRVLDGGFWEGFPQMPEIRLGDGDDPLAGVVRFHDPDVDVVVGRHRWQAEAVARAEALSVGEQSLPVVRLADLILLKLFAGGYRDALDVRMMLDGAERATKEEVDALVRELPPDAQRLWGEVLEGR